VTYTSVAIPCRRLDEYSKNAVVMALNSDCEIEVVLGLNDAEAGGADGDWLSQLSAEDERFRVVRPPRLLSMTENFRFTFAQLDGDWQTIIGSDDGVLPTLVPLLRFVDTNHSDVNIVQFPRAYYFWPGVDSIWGTQHVHLTGHADYELDTQNSDILEHVLSGRSNYLVLPQLYSGGALRKRLVERIGVDRLFSSLSPDVSAAVALSLLRERTLNFHVPAFWIGTSPISNGLAVNLVSQSPDVELSGYPLHRERAEEFFRLSRADGHSLDSCFSDLDGAEFVVAASACTSAILMTPPSSKSSDWYRVLGRLAVLTAQRGSLGSQDNLASMIRRSLQAASLPSSSRSSGRVSLRMLARVAGFAIRNAVSPRLGRLVRVSRRVVREGKVFADSKPRSGQITLQRAFDGAESQLSMEAATQLAIGAGLMSTALSLRPRRFPSRSGPDAMS
jgi:hypothetical protein